MNEWNGAGTEEKYGRTKTMSIFVVFVVVVVVNYSSIKYYCN